MWEIRYFVSIPTAISFSIKFIPAVSKFEGKIWLDACLVGLTTSILFGYSIGIRIGRQARFRHIRKTQASTVLDLGTKRILWRYARHVQSKLDRLLSHREAADPGLLTAAKIEAIAKSIVRVKDILSVYAPAAPEEEEQRQSQDYHPVKKIPYAMQIIIFRAVEIITFYDQKMVAIDLAAKTLWVLYLLYPQIKDRHTSPDTIKSYATIMCLDTLPYFIMLSFPLLFVDRDYFQSFSNQLANGIPMALVMAIFANDFPPALTFLYRVAGLRLVVHLIWALFNPVWGLIRSVIPQP